MTNDFLHRGLCKIAYVMSEYESATHEMVADKLGVPLASVPDMIAQGETVDHEGSPGGDSDHLLSILRIWQVNGPWLMS